MMRHLRAALPLLFLVLGLIFWQLNSSYYPSWDTAEDFRPIYAAWQKFHDGNILAAILDLYRERSWRTIFSPVLAFPVFLVLGGRVVASTAWLTGSFYCCLLFFGFLSFRQKLRSIDRALLATATLGLVPFFFVFATEYQSLLPFLVGVAIVHHFARGCRSFARKRESLLVGSGLALCLLSRPAECLILFGPSAVLLILEGRRKLRISGYEVLVSAVCLCMLAILAFGTTTQATETGSRSMMLVGLALAPLGLAYCKRIRGARSIGNFLNAFSLVYGAGVIWYLPYLARLKFWIGDASMGIAAADARWSTQGEWLPHVSRILSLLVSPIGWVIIALIAVAFSFFANARRRFRLRTRSLRSYPGILAVVLPILVGGFTHNGLLRYYVGTAWILHFEFVLFLFRRHGPLQPVRTVLAYFYLGFLMVFAGLHPIPGTKQTIAALSVWLPRIADFSSVVARRDSAVLLVDELSKQISDLTAARVFVFFIPADPQNPAMLDASAAILRSMEKRVPWKLELDWTSRRPEDQWKFVRDVSKPDYILIGALEGVASALGPYSVIGKRLAEEEARGTLGVRGLTKVGTISYSADGGGAPVHALLLKTRF